jgi:hypothetical protein
MTKADTISIYLLLGLGSVGAIQKWSPCREKKRDTIKLGEESKHFICLVVYSRDGNCWVVW